jgi:16S rRNA (cytidine1402-2'-O)-methyltransferase
LVSGTLFVVATPLGHLGDLSPRAAETLRTVAVVVAEDTRRSRPLVRDSGGTARLLSFHAHSPPSRLGQILALLRAGADVALVTDAGTPTISDPGAALVAAARAAGCPVVVVPGPSAVTAALSVSGFSADRYCFLGFLPRKGTDREALLTEAATSAVTVVLFEAANRLPALLDDLVRAAGGERRVAVARELTKLHEDVRVGTLAEVTVYYHAHEPRGEVTVVLGGAGPRPTPAVDAAAARAEARRLLTAGATRRDVARALMDTFSLTRNDAYRLVTSLE